MIRAISKSINADLFVLSGLYGLISGSTVIDPYDHKLKIDDIELISEKTESLLDEMLNFYDKIIVIVSDNYFKLLETRFKQNLSKFLRIRSSKGLFGYNHFFSQLKRMPRCLIIKIMENNNGIMNI